MRHVDCMLRVVIRVWLVQVSNFSEEVKHLLLIYIECFDESELFHLELTYFNECVFIGYMFKPTHIEVSRFPNSAH